MQRLKCSESAKNVVLLFSGDKKHCVALSAARLPRSSFNTGKNPKFARVDVVNVRNMS